MSKGSLSDQNPPRAVEKHETAAWRAHIEDLKPESQVALPCENCIDEARAWVEDNQK